MTSDFVSFNRAFFIVLFLMLAPFYVLTSQMIPFMLARCNVIMTFLAIFIIRIRTFAQHRFFAHISNLPIVTRSRKSFRTHSSFLGYISFIFGTVAWNSRLVSKTGKTSLILCVIYVLTAICTYMPT